MCCIMSNTLLVYLNKVFESQTGTKQTQPSVSFGISPKLLLCHHHTLLSESNINLTGLGTDMASICLPACLPSADL